MDEKPGKKNDNQNNTEGGRVGAQLRHLKKNSTWLWLIKIFYTIKKKIQSIWKTCKLFENLVWQIQTVCKRHSDVCQGKQRSLSPWDCTFYLIDGKPEVCAAVTNKVLLSGREGTVEFPLDGEQPSFSFSRYSACTGLWHWRTLMASSTLNHSLFLPILTESSQSSNISVTVRT